MKNLKNIRQYQNIEILTAGRVRLVIMLYDGIIRFNKLAVQAIGQGDTGDRNHYINRSLDIIMELLNSLNMEEGGEVAGNLQRLYNFSISQLLLANIKKTVAPIETVTRIVSELKTGWEAIAKQGTAQTRAGVEKLKTVSCGA
ncbi:MAG: flagellar export chaperone FliS [Deltaproteobacteria bacterium]|nr:flagellar export chaperone FliS [Deltaproteobacteria bacterium]